MAGSSFDSRFVLKNRHVRHLQRLAAPVADAAWSNAPTFAVALQKPISSAAWKRRNRTILCSAMTRRPLSRCKASRLQKLPLHPLRRSSLAPRGPPRTSKLKVVLPMARRLFARSIVFVQALDQIRPALGRRLLHKGVKIALKRAPETPRRIHGPSAHDGARSWDVLWRKNANCSGRFRTPPETGVLVARR